MRLTTIVLATAVAFAVSAAYAGVAPKTGTSQAAQSGAKIASKKDGVLAPEEREPSREQDSIR